LTEQEQEMATATMTENMVSKEKCSEVSREIDAAISFIFEKHNLKVTKRASKYGDNYEFKIVAEAQMISEDGINLASPDVIYYNRFGYTAYLGIANRDIVQLKAPIGTKFSSGGKTFAFAGVRSRGKNKILGVCQETKKTFIFADTIINYLNTMV
jgi:hypothetical protein